MAKYSEAQFENLIINWFVRSLEGFENLITHYKEINNKDHTNEFYGQNNSYLNEVKNILKENIEEHTTIKIQHQGKQLTEFLKKLVQKFHSVSDRAMKYLSLVHLAEKQLKDFSEPYQADPEIYRIFKLDQQYAMKSTDSLSTMYYMIKIVNYEIIELQYNVKKVKDGFSYCGVKIPTRFSADFKCIIDESKIIKLVSNDEPIITDDEIYYSNYREQHIDILAHGLSTENSD